MNSNTLFIVLNQDRYKYYNYHKHVNDGDMIFCVYDYSGRTPPIEETGENVAYLVFNELLSAKLIIKALECFASEYGHIKIICTEDKYFMLAAELRKHFGSIGMSIESSRLFRDKDFMKSFVNGIGLKTPKHILYDHNLSYDDIVRNLNKKEFIIKPINGYGSRETYHLKSETEYLALDLPTTESFEVEEYISGKLYHIDSITVSGEVVYAKPFEYSYPCMEYKNGKIIGSLEVLENNAKYKQLLDYNKTLLENIGGSLVTHLEVFIQNNDIIFLEIACRPPGGGLVPLHRIMYDVDFAEIALNFQINPLFQPIIKNERKKYGTFFMFPKPNASQIAHINYPKFESDIEISYVSLKEGDKSNIADSVSQNAAFYLISSEDQGKISEDFKMIKNFKMFK